MKIISLIIFIILTSVSIVAQSTLDCSLCHVSIVNTYKIGPHASTQSAVAEELAGERAGESPDQVIHGADAENCIACHGATAVTVNGGMTETEALSYFFSTENNLFTSNTQSINSDSWPSIACVTCHNVQNDHPATKPTFALYDSRNADYTTITNSSALCGQCHGTLRFAGTDHQREDAWFSNKHGHGGQADVGEEIVENIGLTTAELVADENCIACHASTAVLLNGGMSEAEALSYFYTTTDGKITASTVSQNKDGWPEVACISCHNPHDQNAISYFNSSTKSFETMSSTDELCGQCHGNLRFPETDHLSYNIAQGTGGIGVANQITMDGITCVDCHMFSGNEDTESSMLGGHSWKVFITESDGSVSTSCNSSVCHPTMDVNTAQATVESFKEEFESLLATANEKVGTAIQFLVGSNDTSKILMLEDAKYNLAFAEGDESGGVHNHNYTKAILNNVIEKASYIVTGINTNTKIVDEFELYQNYPNPFNPTTIIEYAIPKSSKVTIEIFDLLGNKVVTLVNKFQTAGKHLTRFDGTEISAGVYFYRMTTTDFQMSKKLVLLK